MISDPTITALNLLAQGRIDGEAGACWFAAQDVQAQRGILHELMLMTRQSHPIDTEAAQAVALTGLRPTLPQCRELLRADSSWVARYHALLRSPPGEYARAYALLMALFTLADTRRRQTLCAGGCTHDWHHIPKEYEEEIVRWIGGDEGTRET